MIMKCSFCSINPGLVQPKESVSLKLCHSCVYGLTVNMKKLPFGAVYCNKCNSYKGFIVSLEKGSMIGYTLAGLDNRKEPIYSVVASKGFWKKGQKPDSCMCGTCRAEIPLWILEHNQYVKSTHFEAGGE